MAAAAPPPARPTQFADRGDAGRRLAAALAAARAWRAPLVLGLPRGGVPVAAEVATGLGAELDVLLVRKLGVPGQPELAFGAIASGGLLVLNDEVLGRQRLDDDLIAEVAARESHELDRQDHVFRVGRPPVQLAGRDVIVVDDGLATGASMRVAVEAVRAGEPASITAAAPVGAPESCRTLAAAVDSVVCLVQPREFLAVSLWYGSFEQVTDADVRAALEAVRTGR